MISDVATRDFPGLTAATICRLAGEGAKWRVQVEAWEGEHGFQGRFVFEPERPDGRRDQRVGPPQLRGRTSAEVLAAAHEVPERRLRALLHSLG